jgi:enoyl-CoA hydratase/carnithine racemase
VGATVAKEWIFTGRQYSAERAFQLGLLNEITLPGQAKSRALALAAELVQSAPLAISWAKRIIDRGQDMSLRDSLELEQNGMTEILPSEDLKEGVLAFLEKRLPKFTKR